MEKTGRWIWTGKEEKEGIPRGHRVSIYPQVGYNRRYLQGTMKTFWLEQVCLGRMMKVSVDFQGLRERNILEEEVMSV